MTISYAKFFAPTILGTSAGTLYTVPLTPAATLFRGGRIRLSNITGSPASATLYAVPNGGSASTTNAFVSSVTVPANGYIDTDVPIMAAGDFIQGLAGTASAINAQAIFGGLFS